jgi:hypothetical protein
MPAFSIKEFQRFALWTVVGLVSLAAGQRAARYLLDHHAQSVGARATAVVVATLCYVPWLCLIGWAIRKADEYERQIHLLGIAYGFLIVFFAQVAIDMLRDADFISWSVSFPTPILFMVAWVIGLMVSSYQYRARP